LVFAEQDNSPGEVSNKARLIGTAKKLTKDERLVQEQMLAILEWASDRPDKWHKIGNLEATKKAAELLAKGGIIEIWAETGLYRIKPQPK
jgi:hypothetical protein